MAKLVQQSTASDPLFFFLTASSDHITGLTGATATVTISKNGAAFAAPSGAVTEIANGWYQVAGNATDTNTLGDILLHATATSADPSDMVVAQVVAFNPRNANLGITNVSANVAQWNGTNVAVPATAGIPDVNAKNINNVSTASVTTINANIGETQPINFTGTGASALVQSDTRDIAGSAVSTTSAQIGVNVVQVNAVATTSVTAINANQGTTQPVNFTGTAASALVQSDVKDIAGVAVSTTTAQVGVNVVQYAGATAAVDTNNLPKVDVEDIAGNATAAQNVSKANQAIGRGTCAAAGTTTGITTSAFSPGGASIVAGQFIGRTVIFDATTASGALQGQATTITNNTSGATPTFTVTALTTAPASGDTFGVY